MVKSKGSTRVVAQLDDGVEAHLDCYLVEPEKSGPRETSLQRYLGD